MTIAVTGGKTRTRILPLVILTPIAHGLLPVNTMGKRTTQMSKLYKCPLWDYHCPYFCQQDREGEGDFGSCLMQEMEGCSPVNECEAFYDVDAEDFEV